MQIAFLLIGMAFLLTVIIIAITQNAERKAEGSWYGWYEHTDPYWEKAASCPAVDSASPAGDDTC